MALLSLKNQKQFDIVSKYGSKRHGTYFILVVAKNFTHIPAPFENSCFFGMKVSKKISKKATIRNKIKRRIRHLVRNINNNKRINTDNTAVIIIPKKSFEKASFAKAQTDFYSNFIKILSSS